MHNNGYYFSRPIYMHKFTSRDVPLEKGGSYGHEKATDIEIQQSHSYEIKSENFQYQPSESQHNYHHPQQQVYEDPIPVIVLRVPGPQKYAMHLQALLQQYLELRAAQFLKVLEEQDRHGQLMRPQQYVTTQEQVAYVPMIAVSPMYHNSYRYQQQPTQQQQQHHQFNHQHGNRQYYHQQPVRNENVYRVPAGDQSYYRHPQVQHHQPQNYQKYQTNIYHNTQHSHTQSHPATSFITYVTPAYETQASNDDDHHQELHTSENYPSDKHTHVIFKKKKNRVANHPQPSITYHQSEPIVVPEIVPTHYNNAQHSEHQPEAEHELYDNHQEYPVTHAPTYNDAGHSAGHHVVAITERTKPPFNYHVAGPTLAPTLEELRERHNPKRMAPFTKEQFEKAKRIMDKSKRNRGSTKLERVTEQPEVKATS